MEEYRGLGFMALHMDGGKLIVLCRHEKMHICVEPLKIGYLLCACWVNIELDELVT